MLDLGRLFIKIPLIENLIGNFTISALEIANVEIHLAKFGKNDRLNWDLSKRDAYN